MNRFLRLRKFYDWFNNCSYLNILMAQIQPMDLPAVGLPHEGQRLLS